VTIKRAALTNATNRTNGGNNGSSGITRPTVASTNHSVKKQPSSTVTITSLPSTRPITTTATTTTGSLTARSSTSTTSTVSVKKARPNPTTLTAAPQAATVQHVQNTASITNLSVPLRASVIIPSSIAVAPITNVTSPIAYSAHPLAPTRLRTPSPLPVSPPPPAVTTPVATSVVAEKEDDEVVDQVAPLTSVSTTVVVPENPQEPVSCMAPAFAMASPASFFSKARARQSILHDFIPNPQPVVASSTSISDARSVSFSSVTSSAGSPLSQPNNNNDTSCMRIHNDDFPALPPSPVPLSHSSSSSSSPLSPTPISVCNCATEKMDLQQRLSEALAQVSIANVAVINANAAAASAAAATKVAVAPSSGNAMAAVVRSLTGRAEELEAKNESLRVCPPQFPLVSIP
jgi:3-polyprenyl-4-hydroxybenzoate decarboxylase